MGDNVFTSSTTTNFPNYDAPVIPDNALLDEDGDPILDENGNYILQE